MIEQRYANIAIAPQVGDEVTIGRGGMDAYGVGELGFPFGAERVGPPLFFHSVAEDGDFVLFSPLEKWWHRKVKPNEVNVVRPVTGWSEYLRKLTLAKMETWQKECRDEAPDALSQYETEDIIGLSGRPHRP